MGSVINVEQIKDVAKLPGQGCIAHGEICRYLPGRHTLRYEVKYLLLATGQTVMPGRVRQINQPVEEV